MTEALPYIQRFRDAVVVVKFGGNAMVDPALSQTFAADIVLLRSVGMKPVVVHGGGPQIGLLERLGKETEFVDGLRVTDAETLDVARMVLVGKVGRDIVSVDQRARSATPSGVSGEDAGLITAAPRDEELGFVGDVASVQPNIIERLLSRGHDPGRVDDRQPTRPGRPTTSTPTRSRAPSPPPSVPRRRSI